MSLVEINWYPDRKELRSFGRISLIITFIVALLLYVFKGLGIQWALSIFAIGFIIYLTSFISLKVTRSIYLGLILLTSPIGLATHFLHRSYQSPVSHPQPVFLAF